ncbi:proteasome assembly chaperone 1 [Denticeps clupeoides]|uniref:Proteasome assembly chaperone 1 n=1 Tax=Denticeps clupeoides TaxID=299321 RepID=A0A8C4BVX5_9TELE|nr:proteasome assembly chaperone 1-like [Denticeps clupeoides]XP_028840229.1 proteasome assembly chaperone 1 [Denticeps clupeoides]
MATFFGEVLSVYSRAVDEDEQEELDEETEEDIQIRHELLQKREVHLNWCPELCQDIESSSDKKLQHSHLILAVGPNAAGFLSAHVLTAGDWAPVGWFSLWNERSRGTSRLSDSPAVGEPGCLIYQQKGNASVLICQCLSYVAEDQLFQWTDKIFACLPKRGLSVLVLSDSPVAEYKTPNYINGSSTPFLRALKTSAYKEALRCPLLEQPNIVTGLAAAVLSHCEVQGVPAVLYQCYSDMIVPDSVTMEAYRVALMLLSKTVKLESCPNADVLQKVSRVTDVSSNLYT